MRWVGDNTELPSKSNISKNGKAKHYLHDVFQRVFDKKLSNDIQVDRLWTYNSIVTDV